MPHHFIASNALLGGSLTETRFACAPLLLVRLVAAVRFLGETRTRAFEAFAILSFFLAMVLRR